MFYENRQGSLDVYLISSDVVNMNHAPIKSIDVECSFNRYKSILRPNRHYFSFANFQQYLVFHCKIQIIIFLPCYYFYMIFVKYNVLSYQQMCLIFTYFHKNRYLYSGPDWPGWVPGDLPGGCLK